MIMCVRASGVGLVPSSLPFFACLSSSPLSVTVTLSYCLSSMNLRRFSSFATSSSSKISLRPSRPTGSPVRPMPLRTLPSRPSTVPSALPPIEGLAGSTFVDFYELLGVEDTATPEEIKAAYRQMAKVCHPDVHDEGHDLCIMLNEAYETLMNPTARQQYDTDLFQWLDDDDSGYTGKALSKWLASHPKGKAKPGEDRAVFVDEVSCIGCKNCIYIAAATFRMENEYGRSRVFAQWLNSEDEIQDAMDSCPVSCIHWVKKADLPPLEYVTQNLTERVNVGVMMAGQGYIPDVWSATNKFLKERDEREARRRSRARYSPAQEESRRAAAEKIMTENMGWLGKAMFGTFVQAAGTPASQVGERAESELTRKRRMRRQQRMRADGGDLPPEFDELVGMHATRGTVPLDRALVPVRFFRKASSARRSDPSL